MVPIPSDALLADTALAKLQEGSEGVNINSNNSASDSGDESSDEPEEHAQLLLHLAVQQNREPCGTSKRGSADGSRSVPPPGKEGRQLDPAVERRMQARRESARVRRATRKATVERTAAENTVLQDQIKQLQAALVSLRPSLPEAVLQRASALTKASKEAAAAGQAAALDRTLSGSAGQLKKRAPGEKMTMEQLKQARREAAHRSRLREKAFKQQLDDTNEALHKELEFLQQTVQQYQAQGTAAVLMYGTTGPMYVAVSGSPPQQQQPHALDLRSSDAAALLLQQHKTQQHQQLQHQLGDVNALLLQQQQQQLQHRGSSASASPGSLQAAVPYAARAGAGKFLSQQTSDVTSRQNSDPAMLAAVAVPPRASHAAATAAAAAAAATHKEVKTAADTAMHGALQQHQDEVVQDLQKHQQLKQMRDMLSLLTGGGTKAAGAAAVAGVGMNASEDQQQQKRRKLNAASSAAAAPVEAAAASNVAAASKQQIQQQLLQQLGKLFSLLLAGSNATGLNNCNTAQQQSQQQQELLTASDMAGGQQQQQPVADAKQQRRDMFESLIQQLMDTAVALHKAAADAAACAEQEPDPEYKQQLQQRLKAISMLAATLLLSGAT